MYTTVALICMHAYWSPAGPSWAGPESCYSTKNQNPNQHHFGIWPKIFNFCETSANFQDVMDGRKAKPVTTLNAKCLKY